MMMYDGGLLLVVLDVLSIMTMYCDILLPIRMFIVRGELVFVIHMLCMKYTIITLANALACKIIL